MRQRKLRSHLPVIHVVEILWCIHLVPEWKGRFRVVDKCGLGINRRRSAECRIQGCGVDQRLENRTGGAGGQPMILSAEAIKPSASSSQRTAEGQVHGNSAH